MVCEKCWADAALLARSEGTSQTEAYYKILARHNHDSTARIRELEAEIAERRMDYGEDCKRLDARIEELELRIADESRACALFQSHIRELEAQLSAAQDRERVLNDDLYYTCELAVAYAHSAADQEWAAKRIEELMPPEREVADDHK